MPAQKPAHSRPTASKKQAASKKPATRRGSSGHGAVVRSEHMQVGAYEVEVLRKRIKNAYVRVDSPDGPVRVSAPVSMSRSQIYALVEQHAGWIERRRRIMAAAPPALAKRGHLDDHAMVQLWGSAQPHEQVSPAATQRLLETKASVNTTNMRDLVIQRWSNCSDAQAEAVQRELVRDLRTELASHAEPLVRTWEPRMGVQVYEVRYRDMQTRWGSCNIRQHRVWLALSLVHMPAQCLELIVVHELCHLLEPNHGPRFKALMSRFLPDWQQRDALLKRYSRGR